MNLLWQQYLQTLNADLSSDRHVVFNHADNSKAEGLLYPISQLGVLRVSGQDAEHFLQGQCTCHVKELTPNTASFGAFCNSKGRVISTFIILQQKSDFLLLLPLTLLTSLIKHLQKYILRSEVRLNDESHRYCLTGLQSSQQLSQLLPPLPDADLAVTQEPLLILRLGDSNARYIGIAETEQTIKLWSDLIEAGYIPQNSNTWELLDIKAGIPWLQTQTSEAYIPQMINLDQLGGISFTKGCYTGQEVVARTHYLGKAKRALYQAEAKLSEAPEANTPIVDPETQQIVGTLLAAHCSENLMTALIVLTSEASQLKNLNLQNRLNTPLTVL